MAKVTKQVKLQLPNGKELEFEATATVVHDSNYGADADGRRGVPMDFIDEVIISKDEKAAIIAHIETALADLDIWFYE